MKTNVQWSRMYKGSYRLGFLLWVVVLEYPSLFWPFWTSIFDLALGTTSLDSLSWRTDKSLEPDPKFRFSQAICIFHFRSAILGIPPCQIHGVFDLGTIPTFSGALSYTNHIASISQRYLSKYTHLKRTNHNRSL